MKSRPRRMRPASRTQMLVLANIGWWGTAAFAVLRAYGIIPMSLGTLGLLTIGMGIAASHSLSRMNLGDTITKVFETGLSTAVSLHSAVGIEGDGQARAAVIRTDLEGRVELVENGEVVGWADGKADRLVGAPMEDIIPDRFLRLNQAVLAQFRAASARGTDEAGVVVAFNLPVLGYDGTERAVRLTAARLGDSLIKTLVPISQRFSA